MQVVDSNIPTSSVGYCAEDLPPSYPLDPDRMEVFPWGQRIFHKEDGVRIYLKKNLQVQLSEDKTRREIPAWGISLLVDDFENSIEQEVVGTYMRYLTASINEEHLSEDERRRWVEISDFVDYSRYCKDIETPEFSRGKVISISDFNWVIEWSDGTKDAIAREFAEEQMGWLVGDVLPSTENPVWFTARVKWGLDDTIEILRDVLPVGAAELGMEKKASEKLASLFPQSNE